MKTKRKSRKKRLEKKEREREREREERGNTWGVVDSPGRRRRFTGGRLSLAGCHQRLSRSVPWLVAGALRPTRRPFRASYRSVCQSIVSNGHWILPPLIQRLFTPVQVRNSCFRHHLHLVKPAGGSLIRDHFVGLTEINRMKEEVLQKTFRNRTRVLSFTSKWEHPKETWFDRIYVLSSCDLTQYACPRLIGEPKWTSESELISLVSRFISQSRINLRNFFRSNLSK